MDGPLQHAILVVEWSGRATPGLAVLSASRGSTASTDQGAGLGSVSAAVGGAGAWVRLALGVEGDAVALYLPL